MLKRFFIIPFIPYFLLINFVCENGLKVPNAPSGLKVDAVSSSQIDISWKDNSDNEDGFKVERREEDGEYLLIHTTYPNIITYSDSEHFQVGIYYYRVYAFNSNGNSSYSNEVSATILPNIPNAPFNLTASVYSYNQIDLSWEDNSDSEDGFVVERKIESEETYSGQFGQLMIEDCGL